MEEMEKKAKNDIALKQAVIDSISIEKKKIEERLASTTELTSKKIADLESRLAIAEDKVCHFNYIFLFFFFSLSPSHFSLINFNYRITTLKNKFLLLIRLSMKRMEESNISKEKRLI